MEIFAAAFLSGSGNLFPLLVLKSVNISLCYGNSPESAFSYAAYGMLLCGTLDDPALGYEFGKLAVAMNDRFDDIALKSRVIYLYAMFIHHWSNHWSSMTPWFRKGHRVRLPVGRLALPRVQRTGLHHLGPEDAPGDGGAGARQLPEHRPRLQVPGLARFGHALSADAAQFPGIDRRPLLNERRQLRRAALRRGHAQAQIHDRHRQLSHLQGGDLLLLRQLTPKPRPRAGARPPYRVGDVAAAAGALLHRCVPDIGGLSTWYDRCGTGSRRASGCVPT